VAPDVEALGSASWETPPLFDAEGQEVTRRLPRERRDDEEPGEEPPPEKPPNGDRLF
jgi:hypothetical protein